MVQDVLDTGKPLRQAAQYAIEQVFDSFQASHELTQCSVSLEMSR